MQHLNYHHLHYFWLVASRGGVTKAAGELRLSPSTLSAQVRALEESLGDALFSRVGKRLVLTETGRVVFRYADEIFSLGREMVDAVSSGRTGARARFSVGVSDVVPKLVAFRLLEPALARDPSLRVSCDEDKPEALFQGLAAHAYDLVLHDAPLPAGSPVKAHSRLFGESPVALFAREDLAAKLRRGFPRSLDGAPLLLPMRASSVRGQLDRFFDEEGVRPDVRGEFHDSALLKVFGQAGLGAFAGPSIIAREIQRQYGAKRVGILHGVVERFYAITVERRVKHPATLAVLESARDDLFAGP